MQNHFVEQHVDGGLFSERAAHRLTDSILCIIQVLNLKGLGWLYRQSFFLYAMFGIVGLSLLWFCIKGPEPFRRRKPEDIYNE